MKHSTFISIVTLLGVFLIIGCGSTDDSVQRSRSDMLTEEEIHSLYATNMYEVIERLRPRWLTARGGMRTFQGEGGILVYQENLRLGGIEVLRDIGPDMIIGARFLDSATATSTLPGIGGGHVAGAIVLTPSVRK